MQWNLIRLRKEHNLSQVDMAKLLGMRSYEGYGKKERGESQFKMDEMFIISRTFNVPIDQIFLPRNFSNPEAK